MDAWTPYDYKQNVIAGVRNEGISWMAPTWVGEHRRRLQAYIMLQGYRDNAARLFMQITASGLEDRRKQEAARDRRREYGDAALLVETARASVLGDQQSIVVEDADQFTESGKNTPEVVAANERQDELRDWAKKDRFRTKLIETERNACSFGDGVYSIAWHPDKRRPILIPYDPGMYFPVLDGVVAGEFPEKVHLAWELTKEDAEAKYGLGKTVVHRITYEMRVVDGYSVPWEDKLQTKSCFMTEAEFVTTEGVRGPDDFDPDGPNVYFMVDADEQEIRDVDLKIDFVPVIHIPNTVAELNHFGNSTLAWVLQLIDDISSVDSDAQFSSDLTGNPILVVKGSIATNLGVAPGTVISVAKDGDAFFLAAVEYIQALRKQADDLRDLLAINSRITSAAQGRIDATKVAAGILLQLSYGPLKTFVEEMRLTREDKYGLMLKFVQRYMILNGEWSGEVLEANVAFGSYLPSDRSAAISDAVAGVAGGVMSVQTAMKMLQEAGVPIDDIGEEIANINARDFSGASDLLDATGSDKIVGDYLGVKIDTPEPPPAPPAPDVPPVPPTDLTQPPAQ